MKRSIYIKKKSPLRVVGKMFFGFGIIKSLGSKKTWTWESDNDSVGVYLKQGLCRERGL